MDNDLKGNICILIFLVSLFSAIWSLVIFPEGFGLIWLIGSVVVLIVATIYLVRWNKQAKKQVSTCRIPVEAMVQWCAVLFGVVYSLERQCGRKSLFDRWRDGCGRVNSIFESLSFWL